MQDLRIALVQRELAWENPAANRDQFAADIAALNTCTDLVVLPEMFTTGFSMAAEKVAEDEAETTLPWLIALAAEQRVAITGSLAVRDRGQVYNRLLFVTPDGEHRVYDKRHLFRMSGEDQHYTAGSDKLIVEWRGWRICPMVCYDLRFPVWARNQRSVLPGEDARGEYDLLLFVANWPAKRRFQWRQLLIARAIENQSYCIGLNRVGLDGNGLDYSGDSLVLAADGKMLLDCENKPGVFSARLDYQTMARYRSKFPCHKDADRFHLDPNPRQG
jgi:omega-amidase